MQLRNLQFCSEQKRRYDLLGSTTVSLFLCNVQSRCRRLLHRHRLRVLVDTGGMHDLQYVNTLTHDHTLDT